MLLRPVLCILSICASVVLASPTHGGEAVWTGLVLATNETSPKAPPPELALFQDKLATVFGYNQFKLVSSRSEVINEDEERWLLPARNFSVRIDARRIARSSYVMELQLYQNDKMLVETWTKLGRQSPIFIRGPQYGRGQLIIVLLVQ